VEKNPKPLNRLLKKCAKLFAGHPFQFASLKSDRQNNARRHPRRAFLLPSQEDTLMTQPASQPSTHVAVNRCLAAYRQAVQAGGGATSSAARDAGVNAYRAALPIVSTRESIRDFIACITHGMVFNVFWNDEGPKLIAAAKAALATFSRDREPAPPGPHAVNSGGRPSKSSQKPGEGTDQETDQPETNRDPLPEKVIIYLTHSDNRRIIDAWTRLRIFKKRLFTSATQTAAFSTL
jgi:hypothetical protein